MLYFLLHLLPPLSGSCLIDGVFIVVLVFGELAMSDPDQNVQVHATHVCRSGSCHPSVSMNSVRKVLHGQQLVAAHALQVGQRQLGEHICPAIGGRWFCDLVSCLLPLFVLLVMVLLVLRSCQ